MPNIFSASHKVLSKTVHVHTIRRNGLPLSYGDALILLQSSDAFYSCFDSILTSSPFMAYRWETPPVTRATIERRFEFVLVASPDLAAPSDAITFAEYFSMDDSAAGIVSFENLGGDAVLVVPSPRGPESLYSHLGVFMRGAPEEQKQELWKVVSRCAQQKLVDEPLWISTAGGGVAWLHVRLDKSPKYYLHQAYRGRL